MRRHGTCGGGCRDQPDRIGHRVAIGAVCWPQVARSPRLGCAKSEQSPNPDRSSRFRVPRHEPTPHRKLWGTIYQGRASGSRWPWAACADRRLRILNTRRVSHAKHHTTTMSIRPRSSWTGTRSLSRARATTSTCASARRSSSSGTNRNRPKPYGRSVPWNGSPSRRKRLNRGVRRGAPIPRSQPCDKGDNGAHRGRGTEGSNPGHGELRCRPRSSPWPGDRGFESWSLQRRVRRHRGGKRSRNLARLGRD